MGRGGGLLVGMIVCSLVLVIAGCEPRSRTIQIRSRDLSVAMVGDEDDVILQAARARDESYMTDEDLGLDAESRAMAREYLMEEQDGDSEQMSRVEAMKMAMLPIHGGAPKAVVQSAPRQAPKFGGGNKRKGKKNNNRGRGGRKGKGGRGGKGGGGKGGGGKGGGGGGIMRL